MNPIPEEVQNERPESLLNLTGQTRYTDDLPVPEGCLHAFPVGTKSAKGKTWSSIPPPP